MSILRKVKNWALGIEDMEYIPLEINTDLLLNEKFVDLSPISLKVCNQLVEQGYFRIDNGIIHSADSFESSNIDIELEEFDWFIGKKMSDINDFEKKMLKSLISVNKYEVCCGTIQKVKV
jgi:hypothetical protein